MTEYELRDAIERLKQASIQSLDRGQFERGVELLNAAQALKIWIENGQVGPMPVDPAALLASAGSTAARGQISPGEQPAAAPTALATPPSAPPVEAPRPSEAPQPSPARGQPGLSESDQHLSRMLVGALDKVGQRRYGDAEQELRVVEERAADPELRERARRELERVQGQRREHIASLVERAHRAEHEEPGNLVRLGEAWKAVLQADPGHSEATEALERVEQREEQQRWRQQIEALREPLWATPKDLRAVEEALLKAKELLDGSEITDPDLRQELSDVEVRLTELRAEIQRVSEGGASNERAGNYEAAIAKYRSALLAGYDVIRDDVTGKPINAAEALARTLAAYRDDLHQRASQRYSDAQTARREGYPETAVAKLEEAEGLLQKVQEASTETDEIRRQVDQALSQAREERTNKELARALVAEGETAGDPEIGRRKLIEAQQRFPLYPDIQARIAAKEQLLLGRRVLEMAADLSEAEGLLAGANEESFKQAREAVRRALERATTLAATSPALDDKRYQAEALLAEIARLEQAYRQLHEKLTRVDEALAREDVLLATRLLEQFDQSEQKHSSVVARRTRLALLGEHDESFAAAEQLFYQAQDYQGVITICEQKLSRSVEFRERARALQRRAEARLWLGQAAQAERTGDFELATAKYRAVVDLRGDLPEADQPLVTEATEAENRIRAEQAARQQLEQKLQRATLIRNETTPRWEAWHELMNALRSESPAWLRERVESEWQAGAQQWTQTIRRDAERQLNRNAVREAYEQLLPLVERDVIAENDPLWRRACYGFLKFEAERLLSSYDPGDWDQAEEFARKARDIAPDEKARDAAQFFFNTVRRSVLQGAQQYAASANPGPQGAVEILQRKMEVYPVLKQDGEMRSHLIRYQLALGAYADAVDHSRAMLYVPGEEALATFWEQLAMAARSFAQGARVPAVAAMATIRARTAALPKQPHFNALYDFVKEWMLVQLRETVRASRPEGAGGLELLGLVQALVLILQLEEGDQEAAQTLGGLGNRLTELVPRLRDRGMQLTLRSTLGRSLKEGEELLTEIQSLRRALELVGAQAVQMGQLRRTEDDVAGLVEGWRQAAAALTQLDETWAGVVKGSWKTDELTRLLDEALGVLGSQSEEIAFWEQRIEQLSTAIGQLEGLLASTDAAWRQEDFDVVIEKTAEAQARLNQAQVKLGEHQFTIPEQRLRCYDTFGQGFVSGLTHVRQRALEKKNNLDRWIQWTEAFEASLGTTLSRWGEVQSWISATPPCLSQARDVLAELERECLALQQKADEPPPEPISEKAEAVAEPFSPDLLKGKLKDLLAEIQKTQNSVEERLTAVQEPLQRVLDFVRRRIVLSNERNRHTLRDLIADVKKLDSCNPDIAPYEKLIDQFDRQTHAKRA